MPLIDSTDTAIAANRRLLECVAHSFTVDVFFHVLRTLVPPSYFLKERDGFHTCSSWFEAFAYTSSRKQVAQGCQETQLCFESHWSLPIRRQQDRVDEGRAEIFEPHVPPFVASRIFWLRWSGVVAVPTLADCALMQDWSRPHVTG